MHQIRFRFRLRLPQTPLGELTALPRSHSWILGPTSKVGRGRGRGGDSGYAQIFTRINSFAEQTILQQQLRSESSSKCQYYVVHQRSVEHTDTGCYRNKGEDWDAYYPGMRKLKRFVPAFVRIVEVHAYRPADNDRNAKSCNSRSIYTKSTSHSKRYCDSSGIETYAKLGYL